MQCQRQLQHRLNLQRNRQANKKETNRWINKQAIIKHKDPFNSKYEIEKELLMLMIDYLIISSNNDSIASNIKALERNFLNQPRLSRRCPTRARIIQPPHFRKREI